jgi:cholesterol transport system auxiliary component
MRIRGASGVALLAAGLLLGGCVKIGAGGKPPAQLLNLTADAVEIFDVPRKAGVGQPIVIAVPSAPAAIMSNRVVVQDGPVSIAYVKDAVWVEPPARLFQRLLSETIAAKTGKVVIDPRQFSVTPGIRLTGQIKSLGVDASKGRAVIIYDAVISRDGGKSVEARRFEASVPVAVIEAVPVGMALNTAANRIADEVAAWIK